MIFIIKKNILKKIKIYEIADFEVKKINLIPKSNSKSELIFPK